MSDLISRSRALGSLNGLNPTAAELAVLDGLIPAASQAIERYCRRSFTLVNRDELYDGQHDPVLLLHHYPVVALDRIAGEPTVVLRVRNEGSTTQRASVRVVREAVFLTRVAAGVTSVERIAFTAAPTLIALANAIEQLGAGWSAEVSRPSDDDRAAYDLAAFPGTYACRVSPAELRLHVGDLAAYDLDPRLGCVRRCVGDWQACQEGWRVVYTSGYANVPEDVQEACAQLVVQLFWQTKRDPGLAQESVLAALSRRPHDGIAPLIRDLLAPYRRIVRL